MDCKTSNLVTRPDNVDFEVNDATEIQRKKIKIESSATISSLLDVDEEIFLQIPDIPSFTDKKQEPCTEINKNSATGTRIRNRKTMHKLWITDLLNTVEIVSDNFFFRNEKIDMVMITGTVSNFRTFPERIRFVLDDGTGTIECFHKVNDKYKSFVVNFLTSNSPSDDVDELNSSILEKSSNCIFDETSIINSDVNETAMQDNVSKISKVGEEVKNWFYEYFSKKPILNYDGTIMHVVGFLVKSKNLPSIQVAKMRPILNFNDDVDYRMEVSYYYKHVYKNEN